MDNRFYIYAHYTYDSLELFYIGKGCGARYKSKSQRNRYWHHIVRKHGLISIILLDNLTEDSSYLQEYLAIKEFNPKANLVSGGRGFTSKQATDIWNNPLYRAKRIKELKNRWLDLDYKKNIAKKMSNVWKNSNYKNKIGNKISASLKGRKLSPEHREKNLVNLEKARAGVTQDSRKMAAEANRGQKRKPFTEAHKLKLRLRRLGSTHTTNSNLKRAISMGAKPFIVINKTTNHIIGEWTNASECGRTLGLDPTRIGDCLRKVKNRLSHKGYIFKFKQENL